MNLILFIIVINYINFPYFPFFPTNRFIAISWEKYYDLSGKSSANADKIDLRFEY